ncbi:hypothetical protein [Streptomyces viridochromogenes]|uniref:hypothetical protein n=1 Tax=Streptomyces viridochromogenes TaxID=1938 RepID=UPI00069EB604|nr:hypothetical protein [Streptomyces viridochromogenes]KOG26848.1 hypothetical protein ADK36_02550 [Streptomyces viridochromogenes]
MLATALVYGGSLAVVQSGGDTGAAQRAEAGRSAPDAGAGESEASQAETAPDDYVPTFFDGRGGIAGVEFTAAQREAIIREALSRGLTLKEARELAYGEEQGKDDARTYVVAGGDVYRQVAPAEEVSYDEASSESGKADAQEAGSRKAPSDNGKASKEKGNKPAAKEDKGDGKATGKADDEADKGLVDVLGDTVKDVVPDPIEDVVESLPDELTPFRTFMADISQPGMSTTFDVQQLDTNGDEAADAVYVAATAQVSDSMVVMAEVVTPIEESPDAHPRIVAVTVTDPATNEVLAAPEPIVVDDPQSVSQAAIGEVVNTVVEVAQPQAESLPGDESEEVATVTEAQEDAQDQASVEQPQPESSETPASAAREEDALVGADQAS